MRRLSVLLSLLVLCAAATARADSFDVPLPAYMPLGPVVGSDGSVYIGFNSPAGTLTIDRIAPGTDQLVPVHTEDYRAQTRLIGGLDGFILDHVQNFAGGRDITAYDRSGSQTRVLMSCSLSTCQQCYDYKGAPKLRTGPVLPPEPVVGIAADPTDALVIPTCHDGPGQPAVTNLATGAITPVAFPYDTYPYRGYRIAGDWVSHGDATLNWRTGAAEPLRSDIYALDYALLDDGSIVYTRFATGRYGGPYSPVYERAPGQDQPSALPLSGSVLEAAPGRVLLGAWPASLNGAMSVGSSDGHLLASTVQCFRDCDYANVGAPQAAGGFVAWTLNGCLEAHLMIWDTSQDRTQGGDDAGPCYLPTLGPARIGRSIQLRAQCQQHGQWGDCAAYVSLSGSGPFHRITLRSGRNGWFTLARHISAARCRRLVRKRLELTTAPRFSVGESVLIRVLALSRCPGTVGAGA